MEIRDIRILVEMKVYWLVKFLERRSERTEVWENVKSPMRSGMERVGVQMRKSEDKRLKSDESRVENFMLNFFWSAIDMKIPSNPPIEVLNANEKTEF